MRRLFTTAGSGLTKGALAWGERVGRWRHIQRGVYGDGPQAPSSLDRARARVLASGSPARGALAGVLRGLDSVTIDDRPTRRSPLPEARIVTVAGLPCADGVQTMIDLASILDDDRWEQALESALRLGQVSLVDLERVAPWTPGAPRIRHVLARRPAGAPPTGSLLETLALQLARTVPGLGEPVRQHEVRSAAGTFIARVDLCWPDLGLFLELDGQQHTGQPVYDAVRETAVVGATGWLPGRFTWHQIVRIPRSSARQLEQLTEQAGLRRPAA